MTELNCYTFNATSILAKLHTFNTHFHGVQQEYDVIAVQETWLHDDIYDGEILFNSDHVPYRRERSSETSSKDSGGGVLLAMARHLNCKRRKDLETAIEIIWVQVILDNVSSVFVGNVYLPPDTKLDGLDLLEESLEKLSLVKKVNDSVILFGDFNVHIKWSASDDGFTEITNRNDLCTFDSRIVEIMSYFDLVNHNVIPTCNGNQLDLVLTNKLDVTVDLAEKANSSTHDALQACISIPTASKQRGPPPVKRTVYNFKKADWDAMFLALTYVCWSNLLSLSSVHDALDYFYAICFAVIKDHVPTVTVKASQYPLWYNSEIISLIKDKESCRKKFVKSGRDKESVYFKLFKRLRTQVKSMIKVLHDDYLADIGSAIKSNPKRYWSYVKSLKATSRFPSEMFLNNVVFSTTADIVNGFNLFFKSVFKPKSYMRPLNLLTHLINTDVPIFKIPLISSEEMKQKLLNLNTNTSSGFGNLSPTFLVNCAEYLCIPLSMLFNMCVSNGVYPDSLKYSNITPIYKQKGDKSDIEMHRGISIEPIISKLFQGIIKEHLILHVDKLICDEQHGFLPGRSTVSNLVCYNDFISKQLDNQNQVHSVYTDFEKAFDVVPHGLLLEKLYCQFGFRTNVLSLFESFLSDRYQRVVIDGVESMWTSVTSGVPQGSILGPYLFIMYINDLPRALKHSKSLLFADDGKIFKLICSIIDCYNFQIDLSSLLEWCNLWKLDLNISKCFVINFSLKRTKNIVFDYFFDNHYLEYVTEMKDLGVIFTSTLNFSNHVSYIVNKAFRMLGFINRTLRDFNDVDVLSTMYYAYVRSRLEYCSQVWAPTKQCLIDQIERVQRKYTRQLCFKSNIDYKVVGYNARCDIFKLQTLMGRRQVSDLVYLHKIINSKVNCSYVVGEVRIRAPERRQRHQNQKPLLAVDAKLCLRKDTFFPRVASIVNIYKEIDVFHFTTVQSFKYRARPYFF